VQFIFDSLGSFNKFRNKFDTYNPTANKTILGACFCELGRYFQSKDIYLDAIDKFNEGLKINSNHVLLLHGLALAYYAVGSFDEDVKMLEMAVALCKKIDEIEKVKTSGFLNDWGVALMKLGDINNDLSLIEQAAEKFEKAINGRLDANPLQIELEWLYNYGCSLDFLGDFRHEALYYEKSIQVLTHVLEIDSGYIHARYNLALAYFHLAELQEDVDCYLLAIDHFEQLLSQDPEDEVVSCDLGLAFLSLAALTDDPAHPLQSKHYFEQAEQKLQRSASLGNTQSYYNLACLYALLGNKDASIHYLERAEQVFCHPPLEDLMHDEWLKNLRNEPSFRSLVSRLYNKDEESESPE